MRLKKHLQEKYLELVYGYEVFVNPTSSDIKDLKKKNTYVRFLIDPKGKNFYVWPADLIHNEVMPYLNIEHPGWSHSTIHNYLTGSGKIQGGKIIMTNSDEIDSSLGGSKYSSRDRDLIEKWSWIWEDIDSYKWASKYINMKRWLNITEKLYNMIKEKYL